MYHTVTKISKVDYEVIDCYVASKADKHFLGINDEAKRVQLDAERVRILIDGWETAELATGYVKDMRSPERRLIF